MRGCFALVGAGNTEKATRWAHHMVILILTKMVYALEQNGMCNMP
ncbi:MULTISPECIES: hypothetical protein [Lysinibacillus]|uniref:Uncharacterized protein n=1 Tax=Lysinibacillus sphaericus (strain C3-41) TaxID=444177 RepID=B1HRB5_LYSSC|nr:hypothetical protein [Lysinibacillus sphaericus]ACA40895.1 hypothetical protein Bsph_3403 [Lysinibacillus sphaericus C3-41]